MQRTSALKRSTPIKRAAFRSRPAEMAGTYLATAVRTFRTKTCAKGRGGCGERFTPQREMQAACGVPCAIAMSRHASDKAGKAAAADDKRRTRARLEELKGLPELLAEAQREFNRFIRLRDALRPCICCGQPLGDQRFGGAYDAGHYRSVGSAPHLRFDERNVHAQRKVCNNHKAGNHVAYRAGLIERIGLAAVEALEADQALNRYSRDEVREIRGTYRAKANALQKELAARGAA